MKKFLIIGDSESLTGEPERIAEFKDYLGQIVEGSGTVATVMFDKIVFELARGRFEATVPGTDVDLKDYDALYVRGNRTLGSIVSRFAKFHNIPCINDYSLYYSGTKIAQTMIFLEEDVDFVPTYYARDKQALKSYMMEKVGCPFIFKTDSGSHGDSNYLIRDEADVDKVLAEEPDVDFLAQDYCPNDRDYRLLMVGDKSLLFERRGQAGSHLNNTSKGGSAALLPNDTLPPEIYIEASRLAKRLGLIIAGFDIVPKLDTDELYFLEINSQPQLRTGTLLEEKKALIHDLFESF